MSNLMNFEGFDVEVFEFEGRVLFNPKHVASCLDIADVNSTTRNFTAKQSIKLTNSDMHSMHFRKLNNAGERFLTESGVYKLIFKSRKKNAEEFQDWVTDEVLPQIRQTGGYIPIQQEDSEQDILAKAFIIANKTIEKQTTLISQQAKRIEVIQPKADKFDKFLDAEGFMTGKDVANIIDIGRNTLYKHLRELGVYTKDNTPYQKYMNRDLFKVISKVYGNRVDTVTLITSKGADYIIELLKKNDVI